MIDLPFESSPPTVVDPRIMVLMGYTKTGKTSNCLQLPNSLLIDLENGSDFYTGNKLNLNKLVLDKKINPDNKKGLGTILEELAEKITKENHKQGKSVYDFIIIDNLSIIEELAKKLATNRYKNSNIGKNFKGNDVTTQLPKGAGWGLYKNAFESILEPWFNLPGKCLILLAHIKNSSEEKIKEGVVIDTTDLSLSGSPKKYVVSKSDAIGILYRNKKNVNQNILSFQTNENDISCGTRVKHLENKVFVFSEKKNDKLVTYWDNIFNSLKSDKTKEMKELKKDDIFSNSKERLTKEEFPE